MAETCRVQLRIDGSDAEENVEIFTRLKSDSEAIEAAFGAPLLWDDAEEARACLIRYELADGAGWRTDERERAEGMGRTADALGRLHEALEPFLSGL